MRELSNPSAGLIKSSNVITAMLSVVVPSETPPKPSFRHGLYEARTRKHRLTILNSPWLCQVSVELRISSTNIVTRGFAGGAIVMLEAGQGNPKEATWQDSEWLA